VVKVSELSEGHGCENLDRKLDAVAIRQCGDYDGSEVPISSRRAGAKQREPGSVRGPIGFRASSGKSRLTIGGKPVCSQFDTGVTSA
jgi:hypothetical protein